MSSNQTTIMHIPTDMVPLIHQLMELRLMTPTHIMTPMEVQPSLSDSGKNADFSEESIIAAADWMENQKKATGMSATEIAAAEDAKSQGTKSPTTSPTTSSPIKKKRKKSAYQCFCSATINTMREREPERLAQLEENKSLWKYLGAKWQIAKMDELLFQKYTEQANHINNQESVGEEQVGTEESKEGEVESDSDTPEDHVEVEKVLSHWHGEGKMGYLVKFVGYKKPEWVDEEHCACDELIKEYWKMRREGAEMSWKSGNVKKVITHWAKRSGRENLLH